MTRNKNGHDYVFSEQPVCLSTRHGLTSFFFLNGCCFCNCCCCCCCCGLRNELKLNRRNIDTHKPDALSVHAVLEEHIAIAVSSGQCNSPTLFWRTFNKRTR